MYSYDKALHGDRVIVNKRGLKTTGRVGTVKYIWGGKITVAFEGFKSNLATYSPDSLRLVGPVVNAVAPKSPVVYKIGCKEIGQGIQQTFDTKEEALARLEIWSKQLGGRVCQLYVLDSEYKAKVLTELVKVS